ncbi:MAG: 3-deoxy-7-phosphoheptulonate synthase [Candidatus Saelkia tenebricola]|nr:3-deoxy-7-phosphoheptulonate synthase [Candidatus Saelkia tenebricola]
MIIVLKSDVTQNQIDHITEKIKSLGLTPMISKGVEKSIIGVIGEEDILRSQPLEVFPGIEKVIPILAPYKLVSREFKSEDTVIDIKGVCIGGKKVVNIAGPCAVESYEQLKSIAEAIKKAGSVVLRGGAFKPRTSPYSFQGLGEEGLKILRRVGDELNMVIVTEIMDARDLVLIEKYADIIQIGARNMQNFTLLREVGLSKKPVLLKRGISATIKEFLMAAEYILSGGNFQVMLCERGIRTFETETRFTLDINAISVIKQKSHLPVIVDPSHGTGKWNLVAAAARASIAAGADGLMIEVHNSPEDASSDGEQSLVPEKYIELVQTLRSVAKAVGRDL